MNRNIELARLIKGACDVSQINDGGVSFRNGYSGRGMYGRKCIAITGDERACMQVISDVICEMSRRLGDDDISDNFESWVELLLADSERDSMGRGIVIYWQDLDTVSEDELAEKLEYRLHPVQDADLIAEEVSLETQQVFNDAVRGLGIGGKM